VAVIIPEKMYIGYDERRESNDWQTPDAEREVTLLGFATYFVDDKAFQKRKATIDRWSKNYVTERLERDDPRWDKEASNQHCQEIRHERPDLVPEYIDNPLQKGFKISKSVRRSGWGSGNVLWRIEDPRGFELEISSANMASIMDCCVLDRGEINTPCRWGWDKTGGSRVVLLPEGSEPYIEATKDTKRANTKVSLRDVNLGDTVIDKKGMEGVYLGKWWTVQKSYDAYDEIESQVSWYGLARHGYTWNPIQRYVFLVDDKLVFISRANISEVVKKIEVPLERVDIETMINDMLTQHVPTANAFGVERTYAWDDGFIFVSNNKIDKKDMSIEFREISEEDMTNEDLSRYDVYSPTSEGRWVQVNLRCLQNPNNLTQSAICFVEAAPLKDLFVVTYDSAERRRLFFADKNDRDHNHKLLMARKWSFIYINYKGLTVPGKT